MNRHGSLNRIYRLVWSQVSNSWVAVAETAKGRGKGKNQRRKLIAAALALTGVTWLSPEALAGPVLDQVTKGSAKISSNGTTTTIDQISHSTTIDWTSFNVDSGQTVNFVQPGSSAVAINEITGNIGSIIQGHINANGEVFLINPDGVLFGKGAVVNVGGLVVSALGSTDGVNFNKGRGAVTNAGNITAHSNSFVVMLGNTVSNSGTVNAPLGTIVLGAGDSATLTLGGGSAVRLNISKSLLNDLAANGGLIKADGGTVLLTAGAANTLLASAVNNTGVIEARTVNAHEGTIELLAGMAGGTVNVGGTLDASAPHGGNGGTVITDGAHVLVADSAVVTTQAPGGKAGTWTIDPTDFTIAASGGDETGTALSQALGLSNVMIDSVNGSTGASGNINVNDVVSWSANTLTLNAQNNINVNTAMNGSGTAGLALLYAQQASGQGAININAPVNLAACSGCLTIQQGQTGALLSYNVLTALGQADSMSGTDLQGMNGNPAGNYALGSNIDAGATAGWNNGAGFTPVGSAAPYTGQFNGLGHTIQNLTINLPSVTNVGLFGNSATGAISNVALNNVNVNGNGNVGGLIGFASNIAISNSTVSGSVSGQSSVGGLAGLTVNNTTVTNSNASAAVAGNANVGGLIGLALGGSITGSGSTGTVQGSNSVGGLVGNAFGAVIAGSYASGAVTASGGNAGGLAGSISAGSSVSNSYASGSVSGLSIVGGLVGYGGSSSISNSYATGALITRGASQIGGLAGTLVGTSATNVYATGQVTGANLVGGLVGNLTNNSSVTDAYSSGAVQVPPGANLAGGLVGNNGGSAVTNGYFNLTANPGLPSNNIGTGLSSSAMQFAGNFAGLNFSITPGAQGNNWVMVDQDSTLNNSAGVAGGTYPMLTSEYATSITNTHQLQLTIMAPTANYTLANDINAVNTASNSADVWNTGGFVPVGATLPGGSFNGNNHTISNLTMNWPTSYNPVGLFGYSDAAISNVGLANVNITGKDNVGALVGELQNGTVTNVQVSGSVSGSYLVGGVVGTANSGTITAGSANVTVAASGSLAGGLVGEAQLGSAIVNSSASGSVAGGSEVGGLVGSLVDSSLSGSSASASATGSGSEAGGLAGYVANSSISNSYATGSPSGSLYVGGLVGYASGSTIGNSYATGSMSLRNSTGVGGLVGLADQTTSINDSYATCAVTGNSFTGGLVGLNYGSISNAYSTGAVTGTVYVGGLVGNNTGSGSVADVYAIGAVSGQRAVGGLAGGNYGSVSNAYAIGTVSSSGGSVGALFGVNAGTASNTYWNTDTAGLNATGSGSASGTYGLTTAQMQTASSYNGLNFVSGPGAIGSNNWVIVDQDGSLNNTDSATGATYPMLASEYSTTISNAHQLQLMVLAPSASYTVATNINAANTGIVGSDVWGSGGFVPVGIYEPRFTGSLNGAGFVIAGLTMNWPSVPDVGLIAVTSPGSLISNVILSGVSITGANSVGGLVGFVDGGTIVGSSVSGTVAGINNIGGLVGSSTYSTFTSDSSSAAVSGQQRAGGLIGYSKNDVISASSATGAITGLVSGSYGTVGGLIGYCLNSSVNNSYATGNVSGGLSVGGLIGSGQGVAVSNSYATGQVTGSGDNVGGLVGESSNGTYTQTYATGNVSDQQFGGGYGVGGLIGYSLTDTISNSYASGNISVDGAGQVGGLVGYSGAFGFKANFSPSSISNSYATGNVSGASYSAGGLVGANKGSISNSYATGTVTGNGSSNNVGGLVGSNDGGATISGSFALGSVSGASYVGGLVGVNWGAISNSYAASGAVSASTGAVGGLVGSNGSYGTVANSYAAGPVNGVAGMSGGLVGVNSNTGTGGGVSGSFWDTAATGQSGTAGGGTPMSTSDMQTQSNFSNAGWDFGATWTMYGGETDPLLQSFMTPLTLTAQSPTITYGGPRPFFGLVSRPATHIQGSLVYSGTALTAVNAGQYTIVPSGLYSDQLGYLITYASGTLTIAPAPLSVTGQTALNKVYNASTSAGFTAGMLSGVIGTDAVALNESGNFVQADVGTGIAVIATDTLSGPQAGNYYLSQPTGLAANITPASLVLTGQSANNKVYNGNTAATFSAGTLTGVLGTDAVAVNASGNFAKATVGNNIAVSVVDTLTGAQAADYTLSYQSTGLSANITPATLTVTGETVAPITYNNSTAAKLSNGVLSGVIGSDSVKLTESGYFDSPNASSSPVAVTATDTISGTGAGNYVLSEPSLTGIINPKALTVTGVKGTTLTYDDSTVDPLTGTPVLKGLLSGQTLTVTNLVGTLASANAGTEALTANLQLASTATGLAGNYVLTEPTLASVTVKPEPIVVTSTTDTKVYDGTTAATATPLLYKGTLYNGDMLVGGVYNFGNANAGTGKTLDISGVTVSADQEDYSITYHFSTGSTIKPMPLYYTANGAVVATAGGKVPTLTGEITNTAGVTVTGDTTGTPVWKPTKTLPAKLPMGYYGVTGSGAKVINGNYTLSQNPANAGAICVAEPGPCPESAATTEVLVKTQLKSGPVSGSQVPADQSTAIPVETVLESEDGKKRVVETRLPALQIKDGGVRLPDSVAMN